MVDSGAFSVWSRGAVIDHADYIRFCQGIDADYFVALDVIPGRPNDRASLSKQAIEDACKAGWDNYQTMVKEIPPDKVIPVYHQNDPIRWLDKYLNCGVSYMGISPGNDRSPERRSNWLQSILPEIESAGVRTHGFGVSSPEMMAEFPWYSVDSTTWSKHAQVWQFLVPKTTRGVWDYTKIPTAVKTSPRASDRMDRMSPGVKAIVLKYLKEQGVEAGLYEVVVTGEKQAGDMWMDSTQKAVVRTIVDGIKTNADLRMLLNMRFYREAAKACGVTDFYFSGLSYVPEWVRELPCVLLSFVHIPGEWKRWLLTK